MNLKLFSLYLNSDFRRIVLFFLIGLPAFIASVIINWALVNTFSVPVSLSYAFVLVMQVIVNFILCEKYVFYSNIQGGKLRKFIKFGSILIIFRFADWLFYSILVGYFGIFYLFAQVFDAFFFGIIKYKYVKNAMI